MVKFLIEGDDADLAIAKVYDMAGADAETSFRILDKNSYTHSTKITVEILADPSSELYNAIIELFEELPNIYNVMVTRLDS
jgi:hypothetical protein